jgi:hypothetical protein
MGTILLFLQKNFFDFGDSDYLEHSSLARKIRT